MTYSIEFMGEAVFRRMTEAQHKAILALCGPNIRFIEVHIDDDAPEDELIVVQETALGTEQATVLNYNGKAKEAVR